MARRLKSIADIRRYVAGLINRADPGNGPIEPAMASKLAYLANILKGIIERGDLEDRITALEDQFLQREDKG